jgi:hypothetical protein
VSRLFTGQRLIAALLLVAAAFPVCAWAFFKPIRIVAPELNGVRCVGAVCVEDVASLPLAKELHDDAMANVAAKLRPLSSAPRAVFCGSRQCYESFGGRGLGITVLNLGVVIAPEAWQIHIVEHELIHMLQAQELGLLGRERTPMWFKEGMPFFISQPPESDLPDYAKPWVSQYESWEQRVGRDHIWDEIRRH